VTVVGVSAVLSWVGLNVLDPLQAKGAMTMNDDERGYVSGKLLLIHIAIATDDYEQEGNPLSYSPRHQSWCYGTDGGFTTFGIVHDTLLVDSEDMDEVKEWLEEHGFNLLDEKTCEITDNGTIADESGIAYGFRKLADGGWEILDHRAPEIEGLDSLDEILYDRKTEAEKEEKRNKDLLRWGDEQRRAYHRGQLSEEKIQKLRAIGFDFNLKEQ
jgi:Helicase associated domain